MQIPSGECKVLPGHRDLADVGAFMPDGLYITFIYKHLVSFFPIIYIIINLSWIILPLSIGKRAVICYIDGSIRVFNLANGNVCMKYDSPDIQLDTVISLDVHPDNNLIAVGTISSRLYVLKTQGAKVKKTY